jgi:hypothetical protein
LLALSTRWGFLGDLTLPLLAAHATLLLGAWVAPLHMGLAYRLVGMFMLSEDHLHPGLAWGALLASCLGAWTLAAGAALGLDPAVGAGGAASLAAGQALFVAQLAILYRHRRRRTFDVHLPFALASAAFGLLTVGLLCAGTFGRRPAADPLWVAAAWWAIAGWAQTAVQGVFLKIATFLTWLHRYAPVAGRQRVPRLDELYAHRLALWGAGFWCAGVFGAGLAGLAGLPALAQASSIVLALGAGAFVVNALWIGAHWRPARRAVAPPAAPPMHAA